MRAVAASLADSGAVGMGDLVFIIGAPYGLTYSPGRGIISAQWPALLGGDIILNAQSIEIATIDDLIAAAKSIRDQPAGREVRMRVLRGGRVVDLATPWSGGPTGAAVPRSRVTRTRLSIRQSLASTGSRGGMPGSGNPSFRLPPWPVRT